MNEFIPKYRPVMVTSFLPRRGRSIDFTRKDSDQFPTARRFYEIKEYIEQHEEDLLQACKIIGGIRSNSFPQGYIEETDTEFRVHSLRLQDTIMRAYCNDLDYKARARITMMNDLRGIGYQVALLCHNPTEHTAPLGFIEEARKNGLGEEDLVYVTEPKPAEVSMIYPRDIYLQLGDRFYRNPAGRNYGLEKLIERAGNPLVIESNIGYGGAVVLGKGFAFICEQISGPELDHMPQDKRKMIEDEIEGEMIRTLQGHNIKTFVLPICWVDAFPPELFSVFKLEKRVTIPHHHPDLFALSLARENALFFLGPYYRENKELIDRAVEVIRPDIFGTIPDEEGDPANSLPLPKGGVYVDSAAEGTISLLRNAGITVYTTSMPFGNWGLGANAGIHCSTNSLYCAE